MKTNNLTISLGLLTDKFTGPAKNALKITQKFDGSLADVRKELTGLNRAQKNLNGFKSLKSETLKTAKSMEIARDRAKKFAFQIKEAAKPSKRLTQQLKSSEVALGKVVKQLSDTATETVQARRNLRSLTREFDKADKPTKKLTNSIKAAENRVSRLTEKSNKLTVKLTKARLKTDGLTKAFKGVHKPSKTLTNQFERAKNAVNSLKEKQIQQTISLDKMRSSLKEAGFSSNRLTRSQRDISRATARANNHIKEQAKRVKNLAKIQRGYNKVKQVATRVVATGAIAGGLAGSAFASQETAKVDLKIALLDKSGDTPGQLGKINKIAEQLGNKLPGTTADFYKAARALSEQGVNARLIAGGGLKAASELAVLLKMYPEAAAELTAKSREAFALKEDELIKMADLTQRVKFAFGIDAQDLNEANKYMAPTLNAMKITGIEQARMVLAIEGLAAQKGLEGSMFGTGFSRFLDGATSAADNLGKKSFADVKKMLDSKKVKFDFYDSKGNFKGLEHTIKRLEHARAGLNDQEFSLMIDKVFGDRGKRIASILATEGMKGFEKALATQDKQASLDQRINEVAGTLTNKVEALKGSLTGLTAAMFEPLGNAIKSPLDQLNGLIGKLTEFVKTSGPVVPVIGGLITAYTSWRSAVLLTRTGVGLLTGGLPGATAAVTSHFKGYKKFGSLISKLARVTFPFLLTAVRAVGIALVANPIGATITAIAAGAYLIYKNWDFLVKWWDSLSLADVGLNVGVSLRQTADNLTAKFTTFGKWWDNFKLKDLVPKGNFSLFEKGRKLGEKFKKWWDNFKLKDLVPKIKMPKIPSVFEKGKEFGRSIANGWKKGGARASGGSVRAGHFYKVNEKGPELLEQGSDSYLMNTSHGKVIPLGKKIAAAGIMSSALSMPLAAQTSSPQDSGNNYYFNVQVDSQPGMDSQELANLIDQKMRNLQRDLARKQRSKLYDGGDLQ